MERLQLAQGTSKPGRWLPLGCPLRQANKTAAKLPVAALSALALSRMETAATWRSCLRPDRPPVYNGLLPVDRFDADGIGISALSVHESGTPPSQKIQHFGAAGSPPSGNRDWEPGPGRLPSTTPPPTLRR